MTAPTTLKLALSMALTTFYAWIFYLAFNPNVDSQYRAYYIDGTTTISQWQRLELKPYQPGLPVTASHSDRLLFENWHYPEEGFLWSKGTTSELFFLIANPRLYRGEIVLDCFYNGPQQRVQVSVNGTSIGFFIGRGEEHGRTIHFDPKVLVAGSLNRIRFDFPDAAAPGGADQRVLAMALRRVAIH